MARRKLGILSAIKNEVPKNSRLLIAVSGGKDSMVLLDALQRLQRMLDLTLEVAHVDHGFRVDSVLDAELVSDYAKKLGIKFHLKKLRRPPKNVNLENYGRIERYKFFKSLLGKRKLNWIVTAHHSQDLAETFLMRLVSNKELRGIELSNSRFKILRPLLFVSREAINEYQGQWQVPFRDDPSNLDNSFLRNRVRNQLVPLLQQRFHERTIDWIAERAYLLSEDMTCLDQIARSYISGLKNKSLSNVQLSNLLLKIPPQVGYRIVELLLLNRFQYRIGRAKSEMAMRVITGQLQSCDMAGGLTLERQKGKVRFKRRIRN